LREIVGDEVPGGAARVGQAPGPGRCPWSM